MFYIQVQSFRCPACLGLMYVPINYLGGKTGKKTREKRAGKLLKHCPYCESSRTRKFVDIHKIDFLMSNKQTL